jgi:enterochelin esterase-like enzyme
MYAKTFALALAFVGVAPVLAQPVVSPEVQSDGRVTFRLKAPDAKSVSVHCEGVKGTSMVKDDQGVWSLTSDALEPDIYGYSFAVDGLRLMDPANSLLKYNLLSSDSLLHVPGPQTLPWEINDVPHGRLHHHFYKSAVAGDERDFIVYTPPGYDPTAGKRYPALYLLHGYSDDSSAWSTVGCANVILDNLIARGEAKPMIIVMPLGYGTMEIVKGGWRRLGVPGLWEENVIKFRDCLVTEVVPQVEKAYRVQEDRKSRAIAGLSMGGTESLAVGLNALDRFAWVGAFSSGGLGADFAAKFPTLDEKANARLRLLWISCGEQDGLLADNQRLCDWLKGKGVTYEWVKTPGQHSFRVWRRNLAQFAPLLFQEKK